MNVNERELGQMVGEGRFLDERAIREEFLMTSWAPALRLGPRAAASSLLLGVGGVRGPLEEFTLQAWAGLIHFDGADGRGDAGSPGFHVEVA
jgi:hypothetical protein